MSQKTITIDLEKIYCNKIMKEKIKWKGNSFMIIAISVTSIFLCFLCSLLSVSAFDFEKKIQPSNEKYTEIYVATLILCRYFVFKSSSIFYYLKNSKSIF